MLKSALGNESSNGSANQCTIVSSSHIGRRVEVDGIGEGTLKYVGGINGKDGLFCGIELDQPNGKHDGTFQGFSYFSCASLHGIFAPLYKVVLVDIPPPIPLNGTIPPSKTFLLQQQEQQRLSRSALPSLDLGSVCVPFPSPTHSAMQISQSSMSSSLLNQSYVMDGSWQFGDDMLASNNTYILPGRGFHDEDDLMSVPVRESILDRVLAQMPITTSLVLEESRVGVENLPVIGSPLHSPLVEDMDGVTPMVENMPSLGEEEMDEGEEDWRATTPIQDDFHSERSDDRIGSAMSEDREEEEADEREEREERDKRDDDREDEGRNKSVVHNGPKGDVRTPSTVKRNTIKKTIEVKKVEERPKKERAPLCPPSTSAKFPVKPKAPSKHQLMMEKLKASMEAEKADKEKAKKEEKNKPRMSLLPPPPSTTMNGKTDENSLPMPPPLSARERTSSTLSVKTPFKQVTNTTSGPSTSSSSISTPVRSTVARKPRVSLLPPPATAKKDEKEKEKITVGSTSKINGVRGGINTSFPTSSFAPKTTTANIGRKKIELKTTDDKKKTISDECKLARLSHCNRAVDALAITLNTIMNDREKKEGMIEKLEKEKGDCQSRVDQLVHRLNETEKTKRLELEALHASNEKTIVSLRDDLVRQLLERDALHVTFLNEEKGKYEGRIEEMTARHQQACALLDEKNAETERALEELMKEKKALQMALATDHDTKVQTLSQEISSLNTALQMKSSEMKELRLKSQHLTMRVDEIPGKDLEIRKLTHKLTELKLQLDQKHEREKLLVQQNEELRRKERTSSALSDSYRTQVDVLQFQLGLSNENGSEEGPLMELNAREGGFEQSAYFTTPVRMRKNRVDSEDRPYSYTLPSSARISQSRNSDDSMTRSVVGMYSANRAQTKSAALDRDVIYAPDQVITSHPRKLSFGEEDTEVEEDKKGGQTDSGIGI